MTELLIEYRYLIWSLGGALALWLGAQIPTLRTVARAGLWGAERDYAAWRLRNALFVLLLLVPLLVATTAVAVL